MDNNGRVGGRGGIRGRGARGRMGGKGKEEEEKGGRGGGNEEMSIDGSTEKGGQRKKWGRKRMV